MLLSKHKYSSPRKYLTKGTMIVWILNPWSTAGVTDIWLCKDYYRICQYLPVFRLTLLFPLNLLLIKHTYSWTKIYGQQMVFVNHMIAYVHFYITSIRCWFWENHKILKSFWLHHAFCIIKTRVLTFTEVFGHEYPISFADIIITHFSFAQVNSPELKYLQKTTGMLVT